MTNFWNQLEQPFFILAPMEAVTDVVFRHVVSKAGAPDVWFSEFTNATGWVHAGQKAIGGRLIKTDDENPIVAQIWGGEPGDMEQLANHCKELSFNGIDINMGCPAKSAIKSGGAALIRNPELAASAIQAAKTAGLPVSVKTRLGYTHVDEWRDWLTHLLKQDIVNLTIHLRTKKEMSKVPAHFELIPEIIKLRDEIAPQTLLTINGDIRNQEHGLELAKKHPGINGIMIGRGVFQDPFCFAKQSDRLTASAQSPNPDRQASGPNSISSSEETVNLSAAKIQPNATGWPTATRRVYSEDDEIEFDNKNSLDGWADKGDGYEIEFTRKNDLMGLLNYHLDLFDHWQPELGRPFETLKRFFKIYIRDFDEAKELRDKLMHAKTTEEVRQILQTY